MIEICDGATATGRFDDQFHVAVPRRFIPLLPSRKLCEVNRSPVQCSGAAVCCRLSPPSLLWLVCPKAEAEDVEMSQEKPQSIKNKTKQC